MGTPGGRASRSQHLGETGLVGSDVFWVIIRWGAGGSAPPPARMAAARGWERCLASDHDRDAAEALSRGGIEAGVDGVKRCG